ncbi:MAG: pseudouridine synthase [Thiolinea sp.]
MHRLDKPTSGVLLFALDAQTARLLSEQFTQRETGKTYLALVRGYTAEHGIIDYPLQEQLDRLADAQAAKDKPAQAAITHYRQLQRFELPFPMGQHASTRYTLLELSPYRTQAPVAAAHETYFPPDCRGYHAWRWQAQPPVSRAVCLSAPAAACQLS